LVNKASLAWNLWTKARSSNG